MSPNTSANGNKQTQEFDYAQILIDLCINLSLPTFTPSVLLMKEPLNVLFLYAKSIYEKTRKQEDEKRQQKIQEEGVWF